jgi:hypothetical protein
MPSFDHPAGTVLSQRPSAKTRMEKGAKVDLLLVGCLDHEYSWDTRFHGRPNGAFTSYALKTLREVKPATYQKWFDAIRTYLPSTRLPQSPRIFGTRTLRRFKLFK